MSSYAKLKPGYENKVFNLVSLVMLLIVCSFFLMVFSYADSIAFTRREAQPYLTRINTQTGGRYTYKCEQTKCVRSVLEDEEEVSLDSCNMLCGLPPLWPKPNELRVDNKNYSVIAKEGIVFNNIEKQGALLQDIVELFKNNIQSGQKGDRVQVNLEVYSNLQKLSLETDESYQLEVLKHNPDVIVNIWAPNYFGARHALETLSQLIWYDNSTKILKILHDVRIRDSPKFPYRGLMVDTARNYFPVWQLKKVVDGMAVSKLNILHLHLTDSQSFPIILPSAPELAYGSYGADMVYTTDDIKDLIAYSRIRGVRLVLEIDAPSHMSAGWNFLDNYVLCESAGGQLNPDNAHVLQIMKDIYTDLLEMSDDDAIFHIGGDEVNLDCWKNTKAASGFNDMKQFWANYTNKIIGTLQAANNNEFPRNIVLWSSPLTDSAYLRELRGNLTLQLWFGNPARFLETGKSIIYSTVGYWYLDCGFGPWNPGMSSGNCDPYTPWEKVYKYRPWKEYGRGEQALGGEICLWSEQVDVDDLETRIWPRAAAFAERVWSDFDGFDKYDVYTRFVAQRQRLVDRGIKNAGIWPRWCSLNPGKCGF